MLAILIGSFFIGCALGIVAGVVIGVYVRMKDEAERRELIRRYR